MRNKSLTLITLLMLLLGGIMTQAQERDSVALTVYNQGTALVQDIRTFTFDVGDNRLNFTDVAAQIDATSVTFRSLTDAEGTRVLEQNYAYDLVDVNALVARYIDQNVRITALDGTVYEGTLLSGRGGSIILLQADEQVAVVSMTQVRDIAFPNLPDGLITRPTLRWLVTASQSGEQQVQLNYLTGGMTWTADYNILLGVGNRTLDLNGWITLNNTSGTSYENAQLKLVAGDVNRLPQPQARGGLMAEEMMYDMAVASAPQVEQREIFEYQLYEIQRLVTVGNNETKQVEFVSEANVPANSFYVYNASPQFYGYYGVNDDSYYGNTGITTVQTFLEFDTGEEGLNADLPAGRIRVYQADTDGAPILIGENQISHTPNGEMVQFFLGNAFDLVGERNQTSFESVSRNVIQETYEIRLRNRKTSEAVEIRVPETLFRWSNWEILNSSMDYEQLNSNTIEFRPTVPAGEEIVITYTVQYSWR